MFLENEGWELCPVKLSFSYVQLLVRITHIKQDMWDSVCPVGQAKGSIFSVRIDGMMDYTVICKL